MPTRRPRSRPARTAALGAVLAAAGLAAPAAASAAEPYRVLAVNACDRAARCHGDAGAGIIGLAGEKPDVIAVNEACEATIDRVAQRTGYRRVFTAAGRVRCPGRGRYGNAILLRDGADPGPAQVKRLRYRRQAREIRTLTCVTGDREVCVTHLDHTGGARTQAKQLRRWLEARAGGPPTVLAGDLNLNAGKANVAKPTGWWRRGDGARMHVIGEAGTPEATAFRVPWSDHPVLRVAVVGG